MVQPNLSGRARVMVKSCDSLISQSIDFCDQLIDLAEQGMSACDEEACMIYFGIMLDSAYKLKTVGQMRLRDMNKLQ